MWESDMLVMNSTFEGIPMIILEAISTGLPVVTTDVGGIKEVLTYGLDSEVTDGSVQGHPSGHGSDPLRLWAVQHGGLEEIIAV